MKMIKSKPFKKKNRWNLRPAFEQLEERTLLDGSGSVLDTVRAEWSDFTIAESAIVREISADDLSVSSLNDALEHAMESPEDDLIVIHTTDTQKTISFSESDTQWTLNTAGKGSITIVSLGPSLTIDGGNHSRIFSLCSGSFQIGGLNLIQGFADSDSTGEKTMCGMGGALFNGASVTTILSKVAIENCSAGSGLFSSDSVGTSHYSKGGGIYNAGSLTILHSVLNGNTALSSGLDKNNNTAHGSGGAIFNQGGDLTLRDTSFFGNSTQSDLIEYKVLTGDSYQTRTTQQEGCGGSIQSVQGSLTIQGGIFQNNSAWLGGALFSEESSVDISDQVLFEANRALSNGGAIASNGDLLLSNSVLSGNNADLSGGGLYLYGESSSETNVKKIDVINCTITGNQAGIVSPGSGAGLYFSGSDNSGVFAKLYLKNSIVIQNREVHSASSDNDLNIALGKLGESKRFEDMLYGYNTLTSFTSWTIGNSNPDYRPNQSPFIKDYHFETQTRGDYRLNYTMTSPAIDRGNTDYHSASWRFDLAGNDRIKGDSIDLGAYEYQVSQFDPAFSVRYSVQEGCNLNFLCRGSDLNGNALTQYYVDLDADGNFDRIGSNLWISAKDLTEAGKRGFLDLAVENSLGERSETRRILFQIQEVPPVLNVNMRSILGGQILVLSISCHSFGKTISNWTIDWGDGAKIDYPYLSTSIKKARYYGGSLRSYSIKLSISLVDSNQPDVVDQIHYYLGIHKVQSQSLGSSQSVSLPIPDQELIFTEDPVVESAAIPSEIVIPVQNSRDPFLTVGEISPIDEGSEDKVPILCSALPAERRPFVFEEDLLLEDWDLDTISKYRSKKRENERDYVFRSFTDDLLSIIR